MHKLYTQIALMTALALASQSYAANSSSSSGKQGAAAGLRPCTSVEIDEPTYVTLGKSTVVRLDFPATRMVVGGYSSSRAGKPVEAKGEDKGGATQASAQPASDGVADVDITLLSPTDLFFLGKSAGSMNVVLQGNDGRCAIKDVIVTVDPNTLQATLKTLMPTETGVRVRSAENTLVLTGEVSDAVKLDQVMNLAASYGDGKKVVNMLRVAAPQQVMLEVKIAEISKTMLERFGLDVASIAAHNGHTDIISGIFGGSPAIFERYEPDLIVTELQSSVPFDMQISGVSDVSLYNIDAVKRDGLVRVLAEPNLMAISGQEASFLSGGKIFIPVAQSNTAGGTTITLEEKEFGVGLKFMPTVLDGSRVNLKLTTEVSELSQTGSPFTTVNGQTSILPSMATRRADTTVQLRDGQSFAIAGLIRNNVTESIRRFPGLGELPIIGALFRSTEFQNDKTELLFVVTPRLVKPLTDQVTLPTDNHIVPTSSDVHLFGRAEGQAKEAPVELYPQNKVAE